MGTFENPISSIFFEKQVARLCAQHALNMLLQKDLFTAVDLAEIAKRLDSEENAVLDADHKESQNMDDSGFFSVQVIAEALKSFKLELLSILHPDVSKVKENPLVARAFICNRSEHWFVIRKFGKQWFELNSCRDGALLLTDTYVSLFLTQLTSDGYSIFVVDGELPDCPADHIISANPVIFVPPKKKEQEAKKEESKQMKAFTGTGHRLGDAVVSDASVGGGAAANDDELQEAIRRSLADQAGPSHIGDDFDDDLRKAMAMSTEDDSEERSFQMALAMSMETDYPSTSKTIPKKSAAEELREKRDAFLKRLE
ncbi:hypothetical protein PMAYCL1PPCAC_26686 [Pristionchus mayeri]|uniref:Ataxin-3 homolog n=1 Tax=Pristionchus mayeri TaxID=1317129 RepID=A0AAN5IB57_9BILA|nr:hypothetical protein PMAYCL1PPCAC_26686 [Pristionchus mayeri]